MSEPLVVGSPAACPDLLATSAPPFPARREYRARGDLGCRERAGAGVLREIEASVVIAVGDSHPAVHVLPLAELVCGTRGPPERRRRSNFR